MNDSYLVPMIVGIIPTATFVPLFAATTATTVMIQLILLTIQLSGLAIAFKRVASS